MLTNEGGIYMAMDDMDMDAGAMQARYDELRKREQAGSLDDTGREELDRLRGNFE